MLDLSEHPAGHRLSISEVAGVRVRVLRLWRRDAALLERLSQVLGAELPLAPNTAAGANPRMLWMGPGEWRLLGGSDSLDEAVAEACGDALHHLADVTDGQIIFAIEGPAAPDLLAKGCSLDFHERAFPAGTCAQSLLAQLHVLIERPGEAPLYKLIVDRTVQAHLQAWMQLAAAEFLDQDA
jgi:sarcosine oxidase subunit gamma